MGQLLSFVQGKIPRFGVDFSMLMCYSNHADPFEQQMSAYRCHRAFSGSR